MLISVSNYILLAHLATIARGYSITRDNQHKMIKSIKDVKSESQIKIEVADGVINAKVIDVQDNETS